MRRLLYVDMHRMFCTRWLRLSLAFMVTAAAAMAVMQRTAMSYSVSIDRVIFLPMAFYGIAVAALVSLFVGDDFGDGVIKIKILAGGSRRAVYCSALLACWAGCAALYLATVATALVLGLILFPINVTFGQVVFYLALGLLTSLAYGGIFCMLSMLIGNRSAGAVACMALSVAMLLLCLHSNQVLAQKAYQNGVANPAYAAGAKRILYGLIHDLNPSGQATQLSSMQCLHPPRYIGTDLLWIIVSAVCGRILFERKEIVS